MKIKEILEEGTSQLKNAAEKVQGKEFREEMAQRGAYLLTKTAETMRESAKGAARTASEVFQKTKELDEEKHISPIAKDRYIAELEHRLREKDREIQMLKKKLAKKNWTRNR